jgi:hypothetical protein
MIKKLKTSVKFKKINLLMKKFLKFEYEKYQKNLE